MEIKKFMKKHFDVIIILTNIMLVTVAFLLLKTQLDIQHFVSLAEKCDPSIVCSNINNTIIDIPIK